MTRVSFFEIPVTDLPRAVAFYGELFGVALETTTIDGHEMALFPDEAGAAGASGALATGESYVPSITGVVVYFAVERIDDLLERATALGGAVLYPKTAIGELGFVAEFQDSEGNRIALSAPA